MSWVKERDLAYQVCARGKLSVVPHFSIVNSCGPLLPYNSLKPFIGTRDVPVTNCNNLERISLENDRTTCETTNDQFKVLKLHKPAEG